MSPFPNPMKPTLAALLLGAALAIPASATEPEVELRCEFRPTQVSADARAASASRESNAVALRAQIADELAGRRLAARAALARPEMAPATASPPR